MIQLIQVIQLIQIIGFPGFYIPAPRESSRPTFKIYLSSIGGICVHTSSRHCPDIIPPLSR